MAFLDACTSTPATSEAISAADNLSRLIDHAIRFGDLKPLERAFLDDGRSAQTFFDLFACAVHALADSIGDSSAAAIVTLVHRCSDIEADLIRLHPERSRPPALAIAI